MFVYFSSPLWSNNCETDIDNDMFSLKFEEKQKKEPKEKRGGLMMAGELKLKQETRTHIREAKISGYKIFSFMYLPGIW